VARDQHIVDSQSKEEESRKDRTHEVPLAIRSQPLIVRRARTIYLVPEHSSIRESRKEEEATRKSPDVWGHERIWPIVIV
jgi:hypothetical protein